MQTQYRGPDTYHSFDEGIATKKQSSDLSCQLKFTRAWNAFGRAVFLGEPIAKRAPTEYVRISNEDKLEDILTLMLMHWKLMVPAKPGLCISLTGSKDNILVEERKKHIFLTGLIQATQATNAWILTCGLNAGIVNLIDEALHHGQFHNFNRQTVFNPIRCIGIAPWGCVPNRDQLLCNSYKAPVRYNFTTMSSDDQPVWFHPLHTHCIFVDDGQSNHYDHTEIASFLSRLSERMATPVRGKLPMNNEQ
ncbi:unnamed protein product [Dicrocoelium dendriticum]|nr:unnamed protein product [Dicrocoelium dendriticum]